nr:hypothetical protein GCM10020093_010180 [Planobispora longispora]
MSSGFSTGTSAAASATAGAVRAERARILSEILDDLDELAGTAVRTMRAEIPAYAAQDAAFHADVRDQVIRHYRSKLAVLFEERTVTLDDIAFTRRAAMRRARAGVALADYINAFRVGQQVFWESVLERAGSSFAGHDAALSLAAPLMRYCDFASTHAANAYMEFQQYAAAEAVRESRDLLETFLAGARPPGAASSPRRRRTASGPTARRRCSSWSRSCCRAFPGRTGRPCRPPGPGRRRAPRGLRGDRPDLGERRQDAVGRAALGDRGRSRARPGAGPGSCATGCRPYGRACSASRSSWRWGSAP